MRNCLHEGYISRSAYAVASAQVAATISLLDVMWSWFWFRWGKRRIGRWRFFGWLVEGGSLIKSGALCHDVIGSHDELMETCEKWNGKTSWALGTMEDSQILTLEKLWMGLRATIWPVGPTRFLCEGLRGAYAKVGTKNGFLKAWHWFFYEKAIVSSVSPFFQLNIWITQTSLHAKSL